MFFATQKREYPKAFRLFTGKASLALSEVHSFISFFFPLEMILPIRSNVIRWIQLQFLFYVLKIMERG